MSPCPVSTELTFPDAAADIRGVASLRHASVRRGFNAVVKILS